jgi:hypothetical protein
MKAKTQKLILHAAAFAAALFLAAAALVIHKSDFYKNIDIAGGIFPNPRFADLGGASDESPDESEFLQKTLVEGETREAPLSFIRRLYRKVIPIKKRHAIAFFIYETFYKKAWKKLYIPVKDFPL